MKPVNRTRRAKNWIRAYESDARVEWTQQQPCVISGRTPCEVVHVLGGGTSRKADARFTVPMSAALHRELHRTGVVTFSRKYSVELVGLAATHEAAWREEQLRRIGADNRYTLEQRRNEDPNTSTT